MSYCAGAIDFERRIYKLLPTDPFSSCLKAEISNIGVAAIPALGKTVQPVSHLARAAAENGHTVRLFPAPLGRGARPQLTA